jgi:hypothetical protein
MAKFCCTNCFSETEIVKFIESNDQLGNCHYCEARNVPIREVDEVGSFVMQGVLNYYEAAAESVGYESAEGGYQLSTFDIKEILAEQEDIFSDSLEDPSELLEDLVVTDGTPFVIKDPYGPPSGEPDEIGHWEKFCETVKNHQRFTTFLPRKDRDEHDLSEPRNFLPYLVKDYFPELITIIGPGTSIFRARIIEKNKVFEHKDLTSPPLDNSKNNRMSPTGISFFYGGMDPETCIYEIQPSMAEEIAVAEFEVVKRLFILDLSTIIEHPRSIFDSEYSFDYEEHFRPFMEHFRLYISKPIRRFDKELEYVPSQVFTEFIAAQNFRDNWLYIDESGNESDVFLNGVMFKSSIRAEGINITLFRGPDISKVFSDETGAAWLLYKGFCRYRVSEIIVKASSYDPAAEDESY